MMLVKITFRNPYQLFTIQFLFLAVYYKAPYYNRACTIKVNAAHEESVRKVWGRSSFTTYSVIVTTVRIFKLYNG